VTDGWVRVVIDAAVLVVTLFLGYHYLEKRFSAQDKAIIELAHELRIASADRWMGADQAAWVAGAERAHEEANDPKEVRLPNPYEIRRMRQEQVFP
jgi:hypothetical protein